jgi:membrane protein DedA with SNARE-associated domain
MNYHLEKLPALAPFIEKIAPYLDKYGYLAVFLAIFMEDFGLPLPGETMLIAGSIYSTIGNMKIGFVVVIAWVAAVLGDNLGYLIGYHAGRRLVLKYGRYFLLSPKRVVKLEAFFDRHGGKVVAAGRFISGMRQFNGVIAGISGMKWRRFLFYNMIGAALWVGAWATIAYYFGSELNTIYKFFRHFEYVILFSLGGLLLVFIIWRVIKHFKEKHKEDGDEDQS